MFRVSIKWAVFLGILFASLSAHAVTSYPRVDFDGDGLADIFLHNIYTGSLRAWKTRNGVPQVVDYGEVHPNTNWSMIGLGDINGDSISDFLWYNTQTGWVGAWLVSEDGAVYWVEYGEYPISSGWVPVYFGDMDGRGREDVLLWFNQSGDLVSWKLSSSGLESIREYGRIDALANWMLTAVSDFNGDGYEDFLWYNTLSGEVHAWLLNEWGFKNAVAVSAISPSTGWRLVTIFDLNGDRSSDLLWSHPDGTLYAWLLNDASRVADTYIGNINSNEGWAIIAIADFNRDGRDDFLWRNFYYYFVNLIPSGLNQYHLCCNIAQYLDVVFHAGCPSARCADQRRQDR
jgi:hypothetical protein